MEKNQTQEIAMKHINWRQKIYDSGFRYNHVAAHLKLSPQLFNHYIKIRRMPPNIEEALREFLIKHDSW